MTLDANSLELIAETFAWAEPVLMETRVTGEICNFPVGTEHLVGTIGGSLEILRPYGSRGVARNVLVTETYREGVPGEDGSGR